MLAIAILLLVQRPNLMLMAVFTNSNDKKHDTWIFDTCCTIPEKWYKLNICDAITKYLYGLHNYNQINTKCSEYHIINTNYFLHCVFWLIGVITANYHQFYNVKYKSDGPCWNSLKNFD